MNKSSSIEEITIRVGKSGISDAIVNEIKRHLALQRIVKVKFLPSAMKDADKKVMAQKIAALCDAIIVKRVGFTVVLKR